MAKLGSRAAFRMLYSKECEGSSPSIPTMKAVKITNKLFFNKPNWEEIHQIILKLQENHHKIHGLDSKKLLLKKSEKILKKNRWTLEEYKDSNKP